MAERLAAIFPEFTIETFAERHHFDRPNRNPCICRGFLSRPVSRILSEVTIPLGGYPGPGRAASWRALFALHRTGVSEPPRRRGRWWALPPPFHPYRRRLRRCVGGGLLSVPLSVGFRRLALRQRPALRCPDFPRAARSRPRSPGLHGHRSHGLVSRCIGEARGCTFTLCGMRRPDNGEAVPLPWRY